MMAIRVRPGIEQTRPMSRTPNVRKAEWDLIRGNHQGQRQLRCIKQAGHKTAPDLMSKLQKILAMQEPSTQDIGRPPGSATQSLTASRHVANILSMTSTPDAPTRPIVPPSTSKT